MPTPTKITASGPDSKPDTRASLTRDAVLRAAVLLADAQGLDALTMRALGSALGVKAMSLYNHVADKDAILDGIVDLVVGEIEVPSPLDPWRLAMRKRALSAHAALLRHPWACALMMSQSNVGPARKAVVVQPTRRLRQRHLRPFEFFADGEAIGREPVEGVFQVRQP